MLAKSELSSSHGEGMFCSSFPLPTHCFTGIRTTVQLMMVSAPRARSILAPHRAHHNSSLACIIPCFLEGSDQHSLWPEEGVGAVQGNRRGEGLWGWLTALAQVDVSILAGRLGMPWGVCGIKCCLGCERFYPWFPGETPVAGVTRPTVEGCVGRKAWGGARRDSGGARGTDPPFPLR